jgi:hypothetical protein
MTFKKNFVMSLFVLAVLLSAQQAFANYCMWTLKNGTSVKYNIQESIVAGVSEEYIDQFHGCCEAYPWQCGKNWVGDDDYYNLQLAAKYNRTNTVKYLLKYHGCAETADDFGGAPGVPYEYNALMFAIKNFNKEMVLWLLHYKADPTVKNNLGRDAKYYAERLDKSKADNAEIVKMVVDAWNKVMGYSQNMIKEKKNALIKQLKGQDASEKLKILQEKYMFRPFVG